MIFKSYWTNFRVIFFGRAAKWADKRGNFFRICINIDSSDEMAAISVYQFTASELFISWTTEEYGEISSVFCDLH